MTDTSTSSGIYACPTCGKMMHGNLKGQIYYCQGSVDRQHQPVAVVRTHDTVATDSYAPVKLWS